MESGGRAPSRVGDTGCPVDDERLAGDQHASVPLCRLEDLARGDARRGEARRFDIEGLPVAVVRIGDDVYAIGDRCTHQNVSLSEGEVYVEERLRECWEHGSQFCLVTGEPLQLPALKPTPVYPVEVGDGVVHLTRPEHAARALADRRLRPHPHVCWPCRGRSPRRGVIMGAAGPVGTGCTAG